MNTLGMKTLLVKEIRRFMRVPGQTILSPLISTSLYFLVFGYSLSGRVHEVDGVPYLRFIVPGLVFMGLANNAFLNSSSSLFITKMQGTVVDLLAAPFGPFELMTGFIGGAMVRGLMVGVLTWVVAGFFTGAHVEHPVITLFFLVLSSYTFSVIGILAAVWADKFEQVNFFPTFVMTPLTFLGGIFYSVRELPAPWNHVSLFNPMVYMVEGLRYGMLGRSGFPAGTGSAILVGVALVSTGLAWAALRSGYKLKA
ncbi:ABC transporter permease [Archangium primigenium]|nr:ABC transporter permease [Archangium primigenium]